MTCADVCGNETTYRSGFCVLLHLCEGVTGFTLFLAAAVTRAMPLIVSTPIFPLCRELLRENGPEMKRKFCEVSSRNRTTSIHRNWTKAQGDSSTLVERQNLVRHHDGCRPERHGTFACRSLISLSNNGVLRMLLRMLSACHPGNGSND